MNSSSLEFSAIKEFFDVRYYGTLLEAASLGAKLTVLYTGFLFCTRYGKDRVTESFTVTSGTTAVRPIPGISNLVGGAGALVSAVRGLALDLAPVRVNCIAPGLVMTEMFEVRASR